MSTVNMTEEQRIERAKLAADARWNRKFDWDKTPMDKCKDKLAELRAEAERGALVLQKRMSSECITQATCYNPACKHGPEVDGARTPMVIDITGGRFVGCKTRMNPDTGLMETAYACSEGCYLYLSANFKHSPPPMREAVVQPEVYSNEAAKTL